MSVISNPAALQQTVVETANRFLKGLCARMAKEAKQVAFCNQLRIVNPRCLCDLSHNLRDYSEVCLGSLPGVQDEWAAYAETTFCDITGPTHLVEWWDSSPSSASRIRCRCSSPWRWGPAVLSAKYTGTDRRHSLDDNGRRQAFMAVGRTIGLKAAVGFAWTESVVVCVCPWNTRDS